MADDISKKSQDLIIDSRLHLGVRDLPFGSFHTLQFPKRTARAVACKVRRYPWGRCINYCMEDIDLKEEWSIIRVCLKYKWPELTRFDLTYNDDEEALLVGIVNKTGESRENLEY